eukprot:Nitzschia sp. Nitz4//scaffold130_size63480//20663//22468//NITZ4_006245-RA/size63480-processed-gene-0.79-mRNA-1//1//CDS//3329535177//7801//frame0
MSEFSTPTKNPSWAKTMTLDRLLCNCLRQGTLLLLLLQPSLSFCPPHSFCRPLLSRRYSAGTAIVGARKFDADEEGVWRNHLQAGQSHESHQTKKKVQNDPEWKFFDTAKVHVSGGDGGDGCVSFLRLRSNPHGGPSGGRGGQGGSVFFVCKNSINTLAPLRNRVHVSATKGGNGTGDNKNGQGGNDIEIPVPPGTIVRDSKTLKVAGELSKEGDRLMVARGGRGGRGNAAFSRRQNRTPSMSERGEPGSQRWLSVELKVLADVGFLGVPNAGKSTLLAASSAARPKVADYPFTTVVPNLGVCDLGDDAAGLVLCDIPGLVRGASRGVGLGFAFLRHIQRCRVLLHVIDGASQDPIADFRTINKELKQYDEFLAEKPQVVVLNKVDMPQVKAIEEDLLEKLRVEANHSRVLAISARSSTNVRELMMRLRKFVQAQPIVDLPPIPEIDLGKVGLMSDFDDYTIISDPAHPGQWRVKGEFIESIAKMTHWEYPEAVEHFGQQIDAIGISKQLEKRGAVDGDAVMVGQYEFEYSPGMSNPYIPKELLERERAMTKPKDKPKDETPWRPFPEGGYKDVDSEELDKFDDSVDWDLLDKDRDDDDKN